MSESPDDELAAQVAQYMKLGFSPTQIQELLTLDEPRLIELIRHHFLPRTER